MLLPIMLQFTRKRKEITFFNHPSLASKDIEKISLSLSLSLSLSPSLLEKEHVRASQSLSGMNYYIPYHPYVLYIRPSISLKLMPRRYLKLQVDLMMTRNGSGE